jgi:peptidyl-prolyl cis-trans isomerase C
VPFIIRADKCMPVTAIEMSIRLRRPPHDVFGIEPSAIGNALRFRIWPEAQVGLSLVGKKPGAGWTPQQAELTFTEHPGSDIRPYDRTAGNVHPARPGSSPGPGHHRGPAALGRGRASPKLSDHLGRDRASLAGPLASGFAPMPRLTMITTTRCDQGSHGRVLPDWSPSRSPESSPPPDEAAGPPLQPGLTCTVPRGRPRWAGYRMHFHDEAEHDVVPFRFEGAPGRGQQIVITAEKRRWLAGRWELRWRRPPTAGELDRIVVDFIREEVLYREALAIGLDQADLVVRRRLVQKMEVLALAQSPPIGDAAMMDYFLAHRDRYRLAETVSFAHAYFGTAARGDRAAADARAALHDPGLAAAVTAAGIGDPPVVASPVTGETRHQVGDRFGADFAAVVFALEPGSWAGPVASAHGQHLVQVTEHAGGRLPEFAEVAGRVAADLDASRRTGAVDALYAWLRPGYDVTVEADPGHEDSEAPVAAQA